MNPNKELRWSLWVSAALGLCVSEPDKAAVPHHGSKTKRSLKIWIMAFGICIHTHIYIYTYIYTYNCINTIRKPEE